MKKRSAKEMDKFINASSQPDKTPEELEAIREDEKRRQMDMLNEDKKEKSVRTTVLWPEDMAYFLEDMALRNKRQGLPDKTVSALVRNAVIKTYYGS